MTQATKAWLAGLTAALTVTYCGLIAVIILMPSPVSQPSLGRFVTKTAIGFGRAALNEQANAAARDLVEHDHFHYDGATIVYEKLDGDTATVVSRVSWNIPGRKPVSAAFTFIFHRTLWALGNWTFGAPPGVTQ